MSLFKRRTTAGCFILGLVTDEVTADLKDGFYLAPEDRIAVW